MQKKRSLWFVLSALLVLSLIVSACGGATPAAEAPAAAAPAAAVEATAAPARRSKPRQPHRQLAPSP